MRRRATGVLDEWPSPMRRCRIAHRTRLTGRLTMGLHLCSSRISESRRFANRKSDSPMVGDDGARWGKKFDHSRPNSCASCTRLPKGRRGSRIVAADRFLSENIGESLIKVRFKFHTCSMKCALAGSCLPIRPCCNTTTPLSFAHVVFLNNSGTAFWCNISSIHY